MKYKLLACDLDGTLLDDNSNVSNENLAAIGELTKLGIEFTLCTGRTFYEIPQVLRECEDIRYIIYSDGSVIFDKKQNKKIYANYIDNKTDKKLFNLLSSYDTMIEYYDDGHAKTDKSKLNALSYKYYNIDPNYVSVIEQTRIGFDDFEKAIDTFTHTEMLNIFFKEQNEREECFERLKELANLNSTTSMDNNIEIMLSSVSKGNALEILCDTLKIDEKDVIAVGDSCNDLSMFSFAGTSVASGSANEFVKNKADFVACSNNEPIVNHILNNIVR